MLLILSGQYVESELRAEFGKIPPSFLPLGNERLYRHQVRQLRNAYDRVALTLPGDFPLASSDGKRLEALGVEIVRTDAGKSLGAATHQALKRVGSDGRIDILYGDTLVYDDELGGTDWIAVGSSGEYYPWHYDEGEDATGDAEAWAGMFSFSNAGMLRHMLSDTPDLIAAVNRYGAEFQGLERRSLRHWLDFGHVQTYFHSRLEVTTQRHFNDIAVRDGVLTKSSKDHRKMAAEAAWFGTAPCAIRPFLPNFIGAGADGGSYSIEYLPLTSLNELYVFGRLPVKVWKKIFAACDRYLGAARRVPVPPSFTADAAYVRRTYLDKTLARLGSFAAATGVDLDHGWRLNGADLPSLHAIARRSFEALQDAPPIPSFVHGDFCFSNILYDFRSDRIKLIDPRGLDVDGTVTSFGDLRYDIGKLSHSVLGLYDDIIAGRFTLEGDGHELAFEVDAGGDAAIRQAFRLSNFGGCTLAGAASVPVMILLFLSMLPLHGDQPGRQRALMANCLRLYQEWCA